MSQLLLMQESMNVLHQGYSSLALQLKLVSMANCLHHIINMLVSSLCLLLTGCSPTATFGIRSLLTVALGPFTTQQRFTIVRQLTVDCLLGADFLHNHDAVIDYSIRTLTVGKEKHSSISLTLGKQPHKQEDSISEDIFVRYPTDLDIPGCTIQLIRGKIDPPHNNVTCFFIESLEKLPAQFCVARSISPLVGDNEIIIQVMNVNPTPLTLYKGMKLVTATPEKNVLLITQDSSQTHHNHPPLESVNFSHLTASEQEEILQVCRSLHLMKALLVKPLLLSILYPQQGALFASHYAEYLKH